MFGIAFFVSPLVFSLKVPKHIMSDNEHKLDLRTLEPGGSAVISVKGTPIRMTQRKKEQLETLAIVESQLVDPESEHSKQPLHANNRSRSIKPEIFVFIARPEYSKKSIVGCSPQPATAMSICIWSFQVDTLKPVVAPGMTTRAGFIKEAFRRR
jgi:hypothetical protein